MAAASDAIAKGLAAAIAELKRQERVTGNVFETNGRSAQIDGSFDLQRLVKVILAAAE